MNYDTKKVHITTIRAGDTIVRDGKLRTVCNNNIGRADLLGVTLFGDSYHAGHKPVVKAINIKS